MILSAHFACFRQLENELGHHRLLQALHAHLPCTTLLNSGVVTFPGKLTFWNFFSGNFPENSGKKLVIAPIAKPYGIHMQGRNFCPKSGGTFWRKLFKLLTDLLTELTITAWRTG